MANIEVDPDAKLDVSITQAVEAPFQLDVDPFRGPKLKVERAKRHIADYRIAHKAFANSDIVQILSDADPQTGNMRLRIYWSKPPPGDLLMTAVDALYNLRAALDQAASCCAKLAGHSPKDTYFPHGIDQEGFKKSLSRHCKKVPEPVRVAVAALEPYYGGDGYLFRVLHDLNLVDKHTALISVAAALKAVTITKGGPPPSGRVWHRREDKLEFVDAATLTNIDQHVQVTMSVTFTDVEAVKGQPVTHILYQLADLVERTVEIIETAMAAWLASKQTT